MESKFIWHKMARKFQIKPPSFLPSLMEREKEFGYQDALFKHNYRIFVELYLLSTAGVLQNELYYLLSIMEFY